MSKPYENESPMFKHRNSSTASLPATSTILRQLLPRPKPSDENIPAISPATSIETSSRGSPLYMRSSSHPPHSSSKHSPRTRDRRSRQSLSYINNQSSVSLDDADVAQKVSQSLAREKIAWKVINREIAEWQNVCHTGRPSWWSPASRWTRRIRSHSSINRDMSTFGTSDWVDEGDDLYYPELCFEYEKRKDSAKDGQPWLQELAFLIAVQLLSACFTLPVDQFATYTTGINITYDVYGIPEMPDERLISSLRMHTNYRWAPAFGHNARNTSPETQRSTSFGGHTPYTTHITPGAFQSSPDVGDSSWRSKRQKQRRAPHVTPAETEHQEYWEDTYEEAYGFESPLRTPTLGSWRDNSWRDRRDMAKSASYIPVPGRVVQSAPPTPLPAYMAATMSRHVVERERRDEYPFPVQADADRGARRERYSLHPHLRSEPHPVFVQPVREMVVKRWRTFRRRFGYSLSHGNPDLNLTPGTTATFTEEYSASTWSPTTPPTNPPPRGVRRRRDARSRHDIHSSSMESSPRYNTPTSGTQSGMASGMTSPGLACAPPQSTPMAGEVDDLIATARAITNSSSALPQKPLTSNQPFPVFTPNNTPDDTEEDSPSRLHRSDAGYFTASKDSSPAPNFVPKSRGSGKRRNTPRGSRRSRLSEVFTQEEVAEEELEVLSIQTAKRRLFGVTVRSTLTTPTEESESDGSKSIRRSGRDVVMSDPPPTSTLSPNLSAIVRLDSPTPERLAGMNETTSPVVSPRPPSVASVDLDPFAFLSPRREAREMLSGEDSPSGLPKLARLHRPSLDSMSRNQSPITQMRYSPSDASPIDPWANRPSRSRGHSWASNAPPSLETMSRGDSRSPSYMDSPPTLSGIEPLLRPSQPSYPRGHLLPSSMSRDDSRSSTTSSPSALNRLNSSLRMYSQPAMPSLVRGDSRSSTASQRPDLQRAVTSFPNVRPVMERAALSWTNTPNNSEDGRRQSWQSHQSQSSNDDAYDPHAVDCHSNLPSARGSPAPGGIRSVKTEPAPRNDTKEARQVQVTAAEAKRSASVGARPSTVRRSVSTPGVRHEFEEDLRVGLGRNRLQRVSSSGTTHFSSGPEGIEVDGLPVGPDKEAWDVLGELYSRKVGEGLKRLGSRRKKAKSFL